MINKLELNLKDEENKKIFNEYLNKEKTSKIKDRYKPKGLDAQNILRYKPNFFSTNSDQFIKKSNSATNIINNNDINTEIINEENYCCFNNINYKEYSKDTYINYIEYIKTNNQINHILLASSDGNVISADCSGINSYINE